MSVQAKSSDHSGGALLKACVAGAHAAGEIIRDAAKRTSSLHWEEKGGSDFVTEVDRNAELAIGRVVRAAFPDAVVIGEELSPNDILSAPLAFVVDPLDGTTNFLHGYPQYSVSIAAVEGGVTRAAAVLDVTASELFTATSGGGSFLNGAPIAVSTIHDPSRALIGTGFPFKKKELLPRYLVEFDRIMRATAGIRRAGLAAIDLSSVACGRFDGFWELDLAPWDVAAGILLVREAGGVVSGLSGEDATVNFGGFVAGNPAIHPWLVKQIQNK